MASIYVGELHAAWRSTHLRAVKHSTRGMRAECTTRVSSGTQIAHALSEIKDEKDAADVLTAPEHAIWQAEAQQCHADAGLLLFFKGTTGKCKQ